MTTVRTLLEQTRSMLEGGLGDKRTVLDQPYVPGDPRVVLRYKVDSLMDGTILSAGLGTFYALAVSNDGLTVDVLPSSDGGPDVAVAAGEIVRVAPRFTTAAVLREWNRGLVEMSSPTNGVYGYGSFEAPAAPVSGVYALPDAWGDLRPISLLLARYHKTGTTAWQRIPAQWQADQNAVRILGPQPAGTTVEFVFAFAFTEATSLDDVVEALGLNEHTMDIPGLWAASRLVRGIEMARNQLRSQGDARRAGEVPAGANLGVSRDWGADAARRTAEEAGRLLAQFGIWNGLTKVSVSSRGGL